MGQEFPGVVVVQTPPMIAAKAGADMAESTTGVAQATVAARFRKRRRSIASLGSFECSGTCLPVSVWWNPRLLAFTHKCLDRVHGTFDRPIM